MTDKIPPGGREWPEVERPSAKHPYNPKLQCEIIPPAKGLRKSMPALCEDYDDKRAYLPLVPFVAILGVIVALLVKTALWGP